jgi:hypothetical protein
MLKPDKNYKMSKTLKRRLALAKFPSKQHKDAWKRAMIVAELEYKTTEKFVMN